MATLLHEDFGRFNIYDEDNSDVLANDSSTTELRGYAPRDYELNPYGSMEWPTFSSNAIIPRSAWPDMIKEGNAKKLWSLHHHRLQKVPIMNQGRTNLCWINAVVGALMTARARTGLPTVNLSSASAGAPGKNYRNVGGWTGEAIRYIKQYGLVPHDQWPNDAINNRYFAPTREIAKQFNMGSWWELRRRNFDELMTCLLLGFDVAVGLQWWGHAVFYAAPVQIGANAFGVVCVNSWGERWENGGMSVLAESKANADEANCISTARMDADDKKVGSSF